MRASIGYLVALVAIVVVAVAREHVRGPGAASSEIVDRRLRQETARVSAPAERTGRVGILIAQQSVDVSPRVASLVRSVNVRPGDVVKKGTVLAMLEARDKAHAVRAAAIAQKSQAERAARSQRLKEATLASEAEAQIAKFDAEEKAAELDLARVLADDAIVRAPFDGTIVERFVEPGAHVAAGTPMFRVVDAASARLRFGVPPATADAMTLGQTVSFSVPGRTGTARVTSISPEVDRSAGLVVIEADAGVIGPFRSGMEVLVYLEGAPPAQDGAIR